MPEMTHPDSSQTITVSPSQVAAYASQGWVKKKAARKARKSTTTTNRAATATKEKS